MQDDWTIRFDGYDPADEGRREALCTVGNGYVATRGSAPESRADGVHYPGTYVAGVYDRLRSEVAGEVVEDESLVKLPNWLVVDLRVEGGPWLELDRVEVVEHSQELDLRRAVLTRRFRFRDGEGRTTAVTQRRFAAMDHPHLCGLEVTVTAEDWSGRLELRSALDGGVENTLVERYEHFTGDHLDPVQAVELDPDSVLIEVVTKRSGIGVAMAARTRLWRDAEPVAHARHLVGDGTWIGHHLAVQLRAGEEVTLEKVVTVFTGRDRAISSPSEEAARWLPRFGRFDELLEGHVLAWGRLWDRFPIEVDGQDGSLRVLRLHLLHLLQTVSPNTVDLDVGVPARGWHGEAYRGHILWDELFVVPVLNTRLPELTRSLLVYRYRRLDEARAAARAAGCRGAMFPWRSASDGREVTPRYQLNPRSRRWLPDATHLQRHAGIAVAYNVWQYHQVTGDRGALAAFGAELLVEIARFFASAAEYDRGRDRYVIRGVVGPDEFHTGYPRAGQDGIDNNAYTNVMAVWVLCRALEALELLEPTVRAELVEALDLGPAELDRWHDITRKMSIPFHDGVISQFEGYENLAELDWDAYRERYGDIQRLDWILEAEGDSVLRYKVSKQADVLMLFYLLSADELRELFDRLGYVLPPETIPATIDYYEARTSHGSTLSIVIHAWVLARAHRERALEFYAQTLAADVADIQGGTTSEGIHLAAMAGSVDLLERCFSGLELRDDRLILTPYWPEALGVLRFTIRYRHQVLTLTVCGERVEVASAPGSELPIEVSCRGQVAQVAPGSQVAYPL